MNITISDIKVHLVDQSTEFDNELSKLRAIASRAIYRSTLNLNGYSKYNGLYMVLLDKTNRAYLAKLDKR